MIEHGLFDDLGPKSLRDRFLEFHREHPAVYEQFKALAFEAIRHGFRHYSARTIWHVMRWRADVHTNRRDGFKLNNNHSPYYARMFLADFPEHEEFFELRRVQQESL